MPRDKGYVSGSDSASDSGASTVTLDPPSPPPPPIYIQFKLVDHNNGYEKQYKINKNIRMTKLKKSYTGIVGVNVGYHRFIFNGRRIEDHDTAETLGLEDGDTIDVYQEQVGGGSA